MLSGGIKFHNHSQKIIIFCFLITLIAQAIFWFRTENIKPNVYVVPPLPSKHSIEALSLGDKEFYFRVLALKIQNAGDTFGRFTPLKYYDYSQLYQWFKILDSLDSDSKLIPFLASNYYSETQKTEDVIYLIQYLDEYASRDIDKNWWWMYQATYMANTTLKDYRLAIKLAHKLANNNAKDAPLWTKEMPAFIYAKNGEDCAAFSIINKLIKENDSGVRKIHPNEMAFMKYFIQNKLDNLKKEKFNPAKCQ